MKIHLSCLCVLCALCGSIQITAAEITAEKTATGATVKIDGKLFTNHIAADPETNKPYFWPIIGPTGKRMTRAYPMEDVEGEKQDHPHHRSLWFGHQDINGFDTWSELLTRGGKKDSGKRPLGSTVHTGYKEISSDGKKAVIVTTNDYVDDKGNKMLEDERRFTFQVDPDTGARIIDADLTFIGSEDTVKLGDIKDAGFNLRVAHSMSVDAKEGGKIINSEGQTDKDAWAKRATWVSFTGPVEGETLGVAMLNHPSSLQHPTPWHARTYGLFTANPFGLSSLKISDEEAAGALTLKKGETLTLRHRVIFHKGTTEEANIKAAYKAYAKEQK